MKKIGTILQYIIYPLLAISLLFNIYFLMNNSNDKSILNIDGKKVMTEKELFDYMSEQYKTMVVNEKVGQTLLQIEGKNRRIVEPTDEQLKGLTEDFASFKGYADDIDKYRDKLTEAYYIHEIFMGDGVDDSTLEKFLEEYYGNSDTKLYELYVYETHDHNAAVQVQEMLESGKTINDVESKMGIEFIVTYTASMENVLSGGEDVVGENMANMQHNMNDMSSMADEEPLMENDYSIGNVYHIMDGEGMEIIQIGNILNMNDSRDVFENLYFSQKYTLIRNTIVNELKGEHVISYH